jgi:hypothetical protein
MSETNKSVILHAQTGRMHKGQIRASVNYCILELEQELRNRIKTLSPQTPVPSIFTDNLPNY